jgi:SAM-dependent methyltransferase
MEVDGVDKSRDAGIPISEQRRMWSRWNAAGRERILPEGPQRQAQVVDDWLRSLQRTDLELIDVGCGAGWLCERLLPFGRVIGTDFVEDVLQRAQARLPQVRFIAGDFMALDLPPSAFDVAVTLEVLSHVGDQPAFLRKIATLLRPGGLLMLSTQNRPVLQRWSAVGAPEPGQLRRWVDAKELRALLRPCFDLIEMKSVQPVGDRGFLRLVNSVKLNTVVGGLFGARRVERVKESLMLGHALMALARRR